MQDYKLLVVALIFLFFNHSKILAQSCPECKEIYFAEGGIAAGTSCKPNFGFRFPAGNVCADNEKCLQFDYSFQFNPSETIYILNWGDGAIDTLTHQQLLNLPEEEDFIGKYKSYCHKYSQSSCLIPEQVYAIQVIPFNPNGEGCDNAGDAGEITVITPVVPEFKIPDIICVNTPFLISNESTEGYNEDCTTDATYEWDFGNDGSVELKHDKKEAFNYQFSTPGTKTIKLTAYHNPAITCGKREIIHEIEVLNVPEPVFNIGEGIELTEVSDCKPENVFVFNPPENACIDVTLPLENITEDRNETTTFRWEVTPTSGATFANENYSDINEITFTEAGTYEVALVVEDNCADGLVGKNRACIKVTVKDQPNIDVETNSICEGEPFTATMFQDEEEVDTEEIQNIEWIVTPTGDEVVPAFTDGNPELTIEDLPDGKYNISASYTTACGVYTTEIITIDVNPAPEVNISSVPETGCPDTQFTITADETEADSYTWYENGTVITGETEATIIRQPGAPGDYEYFVEITKAGCINTSNTLTLTVNPSPTADPIVASDELFCNGNPVDFTLEVQNVNPPDAALQWQTCTVCDGSDWEAIPDATDAIYAGNSAGNYRVLVESDNCSFATEPKEIRQPEPINPKILVTEGSSCNAFTLNVENPKDTYSYQWQLDGVDIEGATASIYAVSVAGDYTVAVTQAGCTDTSEPEPITFNAAPTLTYEADKDFYCSGDVINITLTPEDVSFTLSWEVVPNSNLTVDNISGTGNIVTTIENTTSTNQELVFKAITQDPVSNCQAETEISVQIGPAIAIAFDKTPDELIFCGDSNDEKTVVATTNVENATFAWTYSDGTEVSSTATLATSNTGEYTVTVTTPEGCTATESIEITRQAALSEPEIVAENPVAMACPGTSVLLEANASGARPITSYQWMLDGAIIPDADGATYSATQPGEYMVMVNGETPCPENSDPISVSFFPEPDPQIEGLPAGLCPGDDSDIALESINNEPLANIASYAWTITPASMGAFSDASASNPTLVLADNQSGAEVSLTISLTLISDNGCEQTVSETLTLSSRPVANFSAPSEVCETAPFSPEDQSEFADEVLWSVTPDAGVQIDDPSARNPTITFPENTDRSSTASYTLQQLVSKGGCTDIIQKTIIVHPAPQVSFDTQITPENGCGPVTATFTNTSTGVDLSYNWDFGNGMTDNSANTITAEFLPDIVQKVYIVALEATNGICGTFTVYDTIVVRPVPRVSQVLMSLDENNRICADFPVPISYTALGQPQEIFIDFGDGETIVLTDSIDIIDHTYRNATKQDTTFILTIAATSECGTDTLKREIIVTPNAVEAFYEASTRKACQFSPIRFTSNQFASIGRFISNNDIKWIWGDGEVTLDSIAVSHIYKQPGTYYPMLIVSNGCNIDTCSLLTDPSCGVAIEVVEAPEAEFLVDQKACVNQPVAFTNQSTNSTQPIWNFGDGNTSAETNPEHTFTASGNFIVTLTVQDFNKCEATDSMAIAVAPLPVADFALPPSPYCAGDTLHITNESSGAASFLWEVRSDDNNLLYSSPTEVITVPFPQANTYEIQLTAYDEPNRQGCASSLEEFVSIGELPEAKIIYTDPVEGCGITTISFINDSNISREEQTFFWDFGNGLATREFLTDYTEYQYEHEDEEKEVLVTLMAEHQNGCIAYDEELFHIPAFEENIILPPQGEVICFTPGIVPNQEFRLRHQNLDTEDFQMWIYNQYGSEVFHTEDIEEGWGGTYRGDLAQPDVYIVVVEFKGCINGAVQQKSFPICVRY